MPTETVDVPIRADLDRGELAAAERGDLDVDRDADPQAQRVAASSPGRLLRAQLVVPDEPERLVERGFS